MTEWSDIQSLSGKDRKALIDRVKHLIADPGQFIPKKGKSQKYINEKGQVGYVASNSELLFVELGEDVVPSLRLAQKADILAPQVVVDKGAIRFVTNGADIMRPGITDIDDGVIEGSIVLVVEETNGAYLCFGKARYDAVDMRVMENGKCISNLHYLSDDWWEFSP